MAISANIHLAYAPHDHRFRPLVNEADLHESLSHRRIAGAVPAGGGWHNANQKQVCGCGTGGWVGDRRGVWGERVSKARIRPTERRLARSHPVFAIRGEAGGWRA